MTSASKNSLPLLVVGPIVLAIALGGIEMGRTPQLDLGLAYVCRYAWVPAITGAVWGGCTKSLLSEGENEARFWWIAGGTILGLGLLLYAFSRGPGIVNYYSKAMLVLVVPSFLFAVGGLRTNNRLFRSSTVPIVFLLTAVACIR